MSLSSAVDLQPPAHGGQIEPLWPAPTIVEIERDLASIDSHVRHAEVAVAKPDWHLNRLPALGHELLTAFPRRSDCPSSEGERFREAIKV